MSFVVGAEVVVTALQKKGRIVEAKGGRYRVVVGPMSLWCGDAELSSVSLAKRRARRERNAGPASQAEAQRHEPARLDVPAPAPDEREWTWEELASLDLHGMTVEEALRAVQERLDLAMRSGLDRIQIIHGISGGKLRGAVRAYLADIPSILRFEADPRNAGVTWVYL
jgi:dsDNA-specific endonuclease/ATPase MutS2